MPSLEQGLLWLIVAVGLSVTVAHYRPASIATAAAIGLTVYSVPALIGLSQPLNGGDVLVPASGAGTTAVALAWLGFVAVLLVPAGRSVVPQADRLRDVIDHVLAHRFVGVAAIIGIALTAWLMLLHGPLFFLLERDVIAPRLGNEYLIWKWVNVLGLIAAFATRRWVPCLLFASLITVNLVVGDRTGPVIALLCIAIVAARGYSWRRVVRDPRLIAIALATLAVVFLAKRLYVAIKSPEVGLSYVLDPSFALDAASVLSYFEPLTIHQILEDVIASGLSVDAFSTLIGVLGQLLVMPSAFGIDSGSFNRLITAELYPDLNFGVAYSYLAQGHALAGPVGVAVFGGLFGLAARVLDVWHERSSTIWSWLWLLVGVMVGVYVHRNSIENELALIRHTMLAFGLVALPVVLLRPEPRRDAELGRRIPPDPGRPLLSICIPTFERRESVVALVRDLAQVGPDIEVCVHVDGSTDGTLATLESLGPTDIGLRLSADVNLGRAHAMRRALLSAHGAYTMFYDDDDDIDVAALRGALERLRSGSPLGFCGFIYHLADEGGAIIGSPFPRGRTNFLELRFDDGVRGGKRELVLTNLLQQVVRSETMEQKGRSPTSLLWSRLALEYDVETVAAAIGTSRRLPGGMSSRITRLKLAYPRPMLELYRTHVRGYLLGRYRSRRALLRAIAKACAYGGYATALELLQRMRRPRAVGRAVSPVNTHPG